MQPTNDLIDLLHHKIESKASTVPPTATKPTGKTTYVDINPKLVNYFYERLSNIYMGEYQRVFYDAKKVESSKQEWARFISARSREQIDQAFFELRERIQNGDQSLRYLAIPNVLALMPTTGKYPDPYQAYKKACNGQWDHPVAHKTAITVGVYELKINPEKQMWPLFRATYRDSMTAHQNGERWVPEKPTLPTPKLEKKTLSEEELSSLASSCIKDALKGL